MKVVLKKTILEDILAHLEDADKRGRVVEYILVTPEDYDELREHAYGHLYLMPDAEMWGVPSGHLPPSERAHKVWHFPYTGLDKTQTRMVYQAVPQMLKFNGYPVLVVPADYHPK